MCHSLAPFARIPQIAELILAARPGSARLFRRDVLACLRFPFPVKIIRGGKTRAESVRNALKASSKQATHILVHDGARPLVKVEWIQKLIRETNGSDGAVLGRSAVPTVKRLSADLNDVEETLDRRTLFEAETPQLMKKEILETAYRMLGTSAFGVTDDVSLVERIGGSVKPVSHDGNNLKVTTQADLELAEQLMGHSGFRFGLGFDRHRLVRGRAFYLGGVRLKAAFGPLGHSDGDPLLHAVIDGMLGALGLGDIGDFFSDTNARYKNIKSTELIKQTLAKVQKLGFSVFQIDATVTLERPKLGPAKKTIQQRLSKLCGIPAAQVGVKAKTAEGLGPEGRSEAVSASALVVLRGCR